MTENNSKKKTFAERAAAKPTELHERFAEWIKAETGFDADLKTVQLAVAFRMDFQASPENQAALSTKKGAAAEKEAARIAKRKAALEKELAKLTSAVVVEPTPVVGEVAAPAEEAPVEQEEAKVEEAPETVADEVEVKAEVTETAAEEEKVETTPKPARRSRRTRTTTAAEGMLG